MLLSEYIAALQVAMAAHGDHPVTKVDYNSRGEWVSRAIKHLEITPVPCKVYKYGYHLSDKMETGGFAGGKAFREPHHTKIAAGPDILVYRL